MNGLTLEHFFELTGLFIGAVAVRIALSPAHPRRWGSAVFWLLLAIAVGAGKALPDELAGWGLLAMGALVAAKQMAVPAFGDSAQAVIGATRFGHGLIWPLLLVPAVAIIGSFAVGSQVALGIGCVAGLAAALWVTKDAVGASVEEGGRLLELLGWATLLPPALAALGGIFAKAGVGEEVAKLVAASLPMNNPLVAVVAYCAGMVLFTVMMGNAFAAFPIITLGIGLPFIVKAHGGNPAIMGALGMLSGYCGTLLTPMAANFNLVPVRLLEIKDDFAVIKAQAPFALAIWIFNVVVMAACVYRF
jgi:uncharacterized membrane protein